MDYANIYRAFIADRKSRETGLTGYAEAHHILPRSLGGTDDPENLIRLTPEDHFFAHLVLAKWHDTMSAWGAVMVMHERGRRSAIFRRKARIRYGWARRRYGRYCAEERVGEANPNYKHDTINLKMADGLVISRTRSEWNEAGVAHAPLCSLMTGKARSYKGWMLSHTDPVETGRDYASRQRRNKAVYEWRHLDGRAARLTAYDFYSTYGVRRDDALAVARGATHHVRGLVHRGAQGWLALWPSALHRR